VPVPLDYDDADAIPWLREGAVAGALGALVVAAFFFALDLVAGHPFATPNRLGAAFFEGRTLAAAAPIQPILVLAYTVMHLAVFVALGFTAAFTGLSVAPERRGAHRALLRWGFLVLLSEVIFVSFGRLFAADLLGVLGAGRVAVANVLAAGAMAAFIERRARVVT